jgi:uncharacterized protein (TIGR03435 family)
MLRTPIIVFLGAVALVSLTSSPVKLSARQTEPRLSFEVASIKPSMQGGGTILCHGMDSAMPAGSQPPLGRCKLAARGLIDIISWAYDVQYALIQGGPTWAAKEKFDIEAKAEDPTQTSRPKFQMMLRSLLADQFKLAFHLETREGQGYELTVAKGGARLPEASGKRVPQGIFLSIPQHTITGNGSTIIRLAVALGYAVEGTVIDRTGLAGIYDFRLQWSAQPGELGFNSKDPTPRGPSLYTAIQEQLGLRLESKKVPLEFFVIDHAEPPRIQ